MNWHPLITIQIKHDLFDLISLGLSFLLGMAAIFSLWISRKALKKSEFDSAMSTSPSIIVRPERFWIGIRDKEEEHGYGVYSEGAVILKSRNAYEIVFSIEFECFNAGRGAAFNISQVKVEGMSISTFRNNRTPLYLTTNDEPFKIELMINGKFDNFYKNVGSEIPVSVSLFYTNDQSNIYCKSSWKANIKPFDKDGENLKVREIKLLKRSGKIEYSQKFHEN